MLDRNGIAAIWDTHIAAAAAYGLGNREIAADLTESSVKNREVVEQRGAAAGLK